MAFSPLQQDSGKELRRLFALLAGSMSEAIGSLVRAPLAVRPGEPALVDADAWGASLPRAAAVVRGALEKGFAGKTLLAVVDATDAIALAALSTMAPADEVERRRAAGALQGEDAEAFGQLGAVLCAGFGEVLREQVGDVDVRFADHAVVQPGADAHGALGGGRLAVLPFTLKVGDHPETRGALAVDLATAEAWNKARLETEAGKTPAPGEGAADAAATTRADDDGLDGIPQAEIRGALAAFLGDPDVMRTLRKSCRRVGLELRRRGRGEIPNPAAHRNEIVVIDVPLNDERRFDWCKRIKEFAPTTKVVLLLHHPSRPRVTRAFLAKADVILGYPCDEAQLSARLTALLAPAPEAPTP